MVNQSAAVPSNILLAALSVKYFLGYMVYVIAGKDQGMVDLKKKQQNDGIWSRWKDGPLDLFHSIVQGIVIGQCVVSDWLGAVVCESPTTSFHIVTTPLLKRCPNCYN